MEFDFSEFERALSGAPEHLHVPLLFDLLASGFPTSDEFETAQMDSPERDAPQEPSTADTSSITACSDEEDDCADLEEKTLQIDEDCICDEVDTGNIGLFADASEESGSDDVANPLDKPTSSATALHTPRTQRDVPDYNEGSSSDDWVFCDAWVGAVNITTDADSRLRIPAVDAQCAFADIRKALESHSLPATDLLCRILLSRILFAWEVSVRIAVLRSQGRVFSELLKKAEREFDPTIDWVWSVFGPLDSCDRVDVPVSVVSQGRYLKLQVETPVWIWWYISLVFHISAGRLQPRRWTDIDQIAEYLAKVEIDNADFPLVILANGAATLYKRHIQTLRGARFFARQHPIFDAGGMDDISCLTVVSLGSALSTKKSKNPRMVMRREARKRAASRMVRHVGIFGN